MKALNIKLLSVILAGSIFQQVNATKLHTKSDSDLCGVYSIENNSKFDFPSPPADCSNAGISVPQDIRAHNIFSSTIPRSKFSDITKWYVEDEDVQRFQLHDGDQNQKPGASVKRPRLETFSSRWKRGNGSEWREFSANYYLSDWKEGQKYAIFQIKTNDASNFIIQGLIDKNGKLSVARRGKGNIQLDNDVYRKPFHFRVRSNGFKFEVYYNCKLVIEEDHPQPWLEDKDTEYGFRWGLYRQKTNDDKQIGTTTMYVTGANFDGREPTNNPNPTPNIGPDGYTFSTNEGGTVNVSENVNIAYGANGKFEIRENVSTNTPCNNNTFGDPIPGVRKSCYIRKVTPPTSSNGPNGFTFSANEGETVTVSGSVDIAYGANGTFEIRENITSNTPCTNGFFGDPIPGVRKKCYVRVNETTTDNNNNNDGNNGSNGSSCSFGTPINSPLPSFNKASYNNVHVLGNGPNVSNYKRFRINWNASTKKLAQFAFNTKNGNPDYYVDLRGNIDYNFSRSNPDLTIRNSGLPGIDGAYWVAKDGNNFVMASKNGGYTIYFNNGSAPNCNSAKSLFSETTANATLFPNPASSFIQVQGLTKENNTIYVVDLNGKIILKDSINNNDQINIYSLTAGYYFLKIQNVQSTKVLPFIKK